MTSDQGVNIAVLVLLPIISAILFVYSIDMGIGKTFSHSFRQYSILILLSSGALVKSVNNNGTVTEKVKARTVVLHQKQCSFIQCYSVYS